MKLGPDIMYHLNTVNIPKHWHFLVDFWMRPPPPSPKPDHLLTPVRIQKSTRKCHETKRISTFASSKTNSDS